MQVFKMALCLCSAFIVFMIAGATGGYVVATVVGRPNVEMSELPNRDIDDFTTPVAQYASRKAGQTAHYPRMR